MFQAIDDGSGNGVRGNYAFACAIGLSRTKPRRVDLTIDDPKHYSKPFTVKLTQVIELDTELVDEICLEGEQSYQRMIRSRGK